MIKLIVFDMAGTTVNEDNVVYKTLWAAFNEANYELTLAKVLDIAAGQEKLNAVKALLAEIGQNDEQLALAIHKDFLVKLDKAYTELDVKPCSGAEELFDTLKTKKIKVGLNTGYSRDVAERLLEKLGWEEGEDFDVLVTASDVDNMRPHPDMIELIMAKSAIIDSKTVMKVGDSAIDVEEGKSANVGVTVGILGGAQNKQQIEVANPDYIIDHLEQITQII